MAAYAPPWRSTAPGQPGHGGRKGDVEPSAHHGGGEVVDRLAVQKDGLDPFPQVIRGNAAFPAEEIFDRCPGRPFDREALPSSGRNRDRPPGM